MPARADGASSEICTWDRPCLGVGADTNVSNVQDFKELFTMLVLHASFERRCVF